MGIKASEIKEIIAHFKEKPLFVDLKGRFLSSVVSSISEKEMEGFLLITGNSGFHLFFLSSRGWDSGFDLTGDEVLPCDPSGIIDFCKEENASASFFQGSILILDIILGRHSSLTLLTEASMVNSSVLPLFIEGAEKDSLSSCFRLRWTEGQQAYIVMKEGEIVERFFFDKEVTTGDVAGKAIFTLLETSACDISIYGLSPLPANLLPDRPLSIPAVAKTSPPVKETDRTTKVLKKEIAMEIFAGKAEPLNFSIQYSDKISEEKKEPEPEDFKTKVLGGFSALLKKSLPEEGEGEEDKSSGGPISRYLFPMFNKRPEDKIIKPVIDKEVLQEIGDETPQTFSVDMASPEEKDGGDSFKSHILTSYFSLARSYEEDGKPEKAYSVLEEALEVPQVDRLSVYRYILSVSKNSNNIERELNTLRAMADEFRHDSKILGWINRQIALIYVKKSKQDIEKDEVKSPEKEKNPKKIGFFSRILGKTDKK